jgi:outer membrane protein assembly factor BamE (lipoprotein component of BamABCDE complex)
MSFRFLAPVVLALSSITLSSCGSVTYGQRIDADRVAQIQKGVTTREQITEWFGQPMQTVMMPDGGRTMYFTYTRVSGGVIPRGAGTLLRGGNLQGEQAPNLSVVVGADGIVRDYEYSPGTGG